MYCKMRWYDTLLGEMVGVLSGRDGTTHYLERWWEYCQEEMVGV